ncbi:HAD-IC family P-type ATPase [Candidatus Babeliales bacterium]|nr:HAD-IC family P-type ATPase [Candidatus Babeliales bacterium]
MKSYQIETSVVAGELGVDISRGLSSEEALKRLETYGANELPKKKPPSILKVFLHQFLSPLMFVLLIATIASILIKEFGDAIVIGLAVLLNAIVGFFQEWKAERAAEALRSFEVSQCEIFRDGKKKLINTKDLVVGDIVFLSSGSRVPADIRLTKVVDFQVEEALLTGESEAAKKSIEPLSENLVVGERDNMAFMGTFALSGRAEGIVIATGKNTELGKIAKLVFHTEAEETPIQKQLKRLSWFLGAIMITVSTIIFMIGFFSNMNVIEIISISIALAVASIPEGLLVAMTVILAIGMQRMFKRRALVKRLIAAETLGGVSVICTDKTGTLTEGHLSVVRIVTPAHDVKMEERLSDDIYDALVMVTLNNDASIVKGKKEKVERVGDPSELALLSAAMRAGVEVIDKRNKFPRISEIPFSSDLKYMATVHQGPESQRLVVKGAPEVIFKMSSMTEELLNKFKTYSEDAAAKGFRILAVAYKDSKKINLDEDLKGLTFTAIFVLQDALRPTASDTVEELKSAGIRTVVVTGDHAKTAANIADAAGVHIHENGVVEGSELEKMSDEELKNKISDIDVFARVEPHHKVKIVKAWQANGKSVAMTGDGVNDAPAIRKADIGIALGAGSDLSYEIADMVLLDNNLATVSAAVREGRIIFENIRKVIVYLLVDSFSEVLLIGGSILLKLPLPFTAVQILWINLVSDGFPSLALTMEPGEKGIMLDAPRKKDEPIINLEMKVIIFLIGIITDLGLFGLFLMLLKYDFELAHIQTIMFTALAVDSLLYVFSVRTMRSSIFRVNPFSNRWLVPAVFLGLVIQLSAIYIPFLQKLFLTVPLSLQEWGIIGVLSLVKIVGIEISKEWFILKQRSKKIIQS